MTTHCPYCGHATSTVIETRQHQSETWRHRRCANSECGVKFVTCEIAKRNNAVLRWPAELKKAELERLRQRKEPTP